MGGLRKSCNLDRQPGDASLARRHVAESCRGLDPEVVATAQLLTSELFTNALEHSDGSITLTVTHNGVLRVEVTDDSELPPVVRNVDLEDEHGRGMLLVASLAKAWGAGRSPRTRGKYVWFTLDPVAC
jgi:serine/threonine-protein kinase RsbW